MSEEQTEAPRNEDETLDAIDALLTGDPVETETPERAEAEPQPAETQAEAEEEQAEEPETEDAETVDYEQLIPMADGRDPMSLGDLKDAYNNVEREKSDIDASRMALIKQETELGQFMSEAGLEIPPQFKQYIADKQKSYLEDQHKLMLKMIPDTAERGGFDKVRAGIVETAKASNFSEEEIGNIADARVVHLINRLAVLEAEKAKAQETVKQLKPKAGAKGSKPRLASSKSNVDKQFAAALESNDQSQKDAAIEALLSA